MGFEPCSVRKINDAGRDVVDRGVSIIAGDRGRMAERIWEREQRPPAKAGGFPLPLLGDDRLAGRAGRRNRGDRRRAWASPSEQFLENVAIVGRSGGPSDRHLRSGPMPLRRNRLRWRGELGRTGGRQGKLSVSPISGKSRAGGAGRLPTGGIAGAGAGERVRGWQREWRVRSGRSSFEARHPRRWGQSNRLLELGEQVSVDGDVAERLRDGRRRRRHRGPMGEDPFRGRAAPVQHPDADSPGEGRRGRARKDFKENPPRTVPALKRKVVECCVYSVHPLPYAYASQLNSN